MTRQRVHYVKTCRHPQNRKYITYRKAIRGRPGHNHTTVNMHKIGHEFRGRVVSEICEMTVKQTPSPVITCQNILQSSGGEVKKAAKHPTTKKSCVSYQRRYSLLYCFKLHWFDLLWICCTAYYTKTQIEPVEYALYCTL